MATAKQHYDLIRMFKWAIMKSFDNNPNSTVCLNDLQNDVEKAWDELQEEEKII